MSTVQSVDLMSLRSAVLGTLANVASKSFDRDLLTDGDSHSVQATIAGIVDGRKFSFPVDSVLTIGHSTERKATAYPSTESILAFVLEQLESKQVDSIVKKIKKQFVNGAEPVCESGKQIVDVLLDDLLSTVTTQKVTKVRGSVNVSNSTKTVEMKISNSRVA